MYRKNLKISQNPIFGNLGVKIGLAWIAAISGFFFGNCKPTRRWIVKWKWMWRIRSGRIHAFDRVLRLLVWVGVKIGQRLIGFHRLISNKIVRIIWKMARYWCGHGAKSSMRWVLACVIGFIVEFKAFTESSLCHIGLSTDLIQCPRLPCSP